jgi:branched-chain amino acid transport system ATP-binding protein
MSVLALDHVTQRFGGAVVLDDISLECAPGEAVGLVGANGAGKTTLFRVIAGEIPPSSGVVSFDGRPLPARIDARARLGIGRTFQTVQLFGGLSVLDHLLVALQAQQLRVGPLRDLRLRGATTSHERFVCLGVLELVGLRERAGDPATALSLGERRMVELARALVTSPRLLLLDEPTSGLDRDESTELVAIVKRVHAESNVTLLIVEHDVTVISAVTQRAVALDQGRVVADGPVSTVLADAVVRRSWLGVMA